MEVAAGSYQGRFADVRTGLGREVERGIDLIEELLQELESTRAELKKTKLDLETQSDTRRRLQQEAKETQEWKERHGRRPFVVALIDADADSYVFHDNFISRGAKGGEDAADALQAALQQYARQVAGEAGAVDVLVRAFANVGGLGAALERDGRLRDAGQLAAFAAGFSSRRAFFDFVDVGPGKERADNKIRKSTEFFLESFQCRHVVLACAHDAGYAPFLGQFLADREAAARITLLEGGPVPAAIRNLGLQAARFPSVFNNIKEPRAAPAAPTAPAAAAPTAGPAWAAALAAAVAPAPAPAPPAPSPPGQGAQWPERLAAGRWRDAQARPGRLGPVLRAEDGRRADRPLQPKPAALDRVRRAGLCYWLYLRGECATSCGRNHNHRTLTDDEFDALWWLARQARCFKNRKAGRDAARDCADALCIYGHGGAAV